MEHSPLYSVLSNVSFYSPMYHGLFLWFPFSTRLHIPHAPYCLVSPSCTHINYSYLPYQYLPLDRSSIFPLICFSGDHDMFLLHSYLPIIAIISFFDSRPMIFPAQQFGLWRSRSLFVHQWPLTITTSVITYRRFYALIPTSDVRHPRTLSIPIQQ